MSAPSLLHVALDRGPRVAFRIVQAVGAAALMVGPWAVLMDLYEGAAEARLMGVVMIITAASPRLAPPAGSGLLILKNERGFSGRSPRLGSEPWS